MNESIKVLLVDDHVLVRDSVGRMLQSEPGIDVVGAVGNADEALGMGLVTRVVPADDLMSEAWRIARQLAAMKANLLAAIKECLLRGAEVPLSQALPMEAAVAARALG